VRTAQKRDRRGERIIKERKERKRKGKVLETKNEGIKGKDI